MHTVATIALADRPTDSLGHSSSLGDTPISVCHVSEGAAWAGAEVQLTTLLRALSKRSDVSVHAFLLQDGRLAQELRSSRVDVMVATGEHKRLPIKLLECAKLLRERDTQILHSHGYKESTIALSLSLMCNVPHLVRTEHGHPEPYSALRNPKHWCALTADRLSAKLSAAQIVSVSSDLANFWAQRVNPSRVNVIRNGIDLDVVKSSFTAAEAKQRLGISSKSFVIGTAARLETVKRLDLFLATAAYVTQRIPDVHFILAGEGRQKEFLQSLIFKYGLQHQATMVGERQDVFDILRAMDLLLICSDHEGVPMVMLEAMALQVPVISRRVGGIPEVIHDGVHGILVTSDSPQELGRACVSLFNDRLLLAELRMAARNEIQEHYSADRNAEQVAGFYNALCGRQLQ
jgi:glycosyltransferase involved in cell wall biosynthesis